MKTMKAIETHYKGHRFRSRLEARWAVFFDAAGISWRYEYEGIERSKEGETLRWLPDFYLPDLARHIEVKPRGLARFNKKDYVEHIIKEIFFYDYVPMATLVGSPYPGAYGLLLIDPISHGGRTTSATSFAIFGQCRRCKGMCLVRLNLSPGYAYYHDENQWDLERTTAAFTNFGPHTCGDHERWPQPLSPCLQAAYRRARSARFEHGEKP